MNVYSHERTNDLDQMHIYEMIVTGANYLVFLCLRNENSIYAQDDYSTFFY